MPKTGGKRKKTKTHEQQEELGNDIPRCKIYNIIYINFILNSSYN
jgi:hypothetical protein